MRRRYGGIALALALWLGEALAAAAPPGAAVTTAPAADGHALGFSWFAGDLDAALAAARQQHEPVFVYWGAVWCPPCRALKAEVFPQPRFAERMRGFIPVYLDGDADDAQRWADRLGVSSYPTLLVLNGDGKEQLRILGAVDLEELDASLAAVSASGAALADRVAAAVARPASVSDAEWALLASSTWLDPTLPPAGGLGPLLTRVAQLADRVPPRLPESGARLAGAVLQLATAEAPASDGAFAAARASVAADCARHLDRWLHDERTIVAARQPLLDAAAEIAALCRATAGVGLDERLVRAARLVGARDELPVEVRLAALGPEIALWKQHAGAQSVPPAELQERARAQTKALLALPIPEALRHTSVAAAAEVLHAYREDDAARALLVEELKVSRVPWYLQGELATIAAARGENDAALRWSAAAVRSAQGHATQVQWRVAELELLAKLRPRGPDDELLARLRDFYALVRELPDGFAGRNRRRLGMVAKALAPVAARPAVQAALAAEQARCATLAAPRRAVCQDHFAAIAPR